MAYNAALKLCTVLLYAEGYRPENSLAHFRTLQALRLILGDKYKSDADYLDGCRVKRNKAEYDTVGVVTLEEARELQDYAVELKKVVLDWLNKEHRPLVP